MRRDPLALRVYTSRLLGSDPSLVLHGGGNTSVKASALNIFGEWEEVLYVKGSGWDLATIEAPGFAPVRLDALRRLAAFEELSDSAMVTAQRAALIDPYAPNPSVEAILHAIIPFRFVDHSHADAVVALTNAADGEARVRKLYGAQMLIVPYVMPGFILARTIYKMAQATDWQKLAGMVLLNHGLFTFADDARESYERHIEIVSAAEAYIEKRVSGRANGVERGADSDSCIPLLELANLRRAVSRAKGQALLASLDDTADVRAFSMLPEAPRLATRGLLTPDHVIRTKRIPLVVTEKGADADVDDYAAAYDEYFARHTDGSLAQLDSAPRWALWPGLGSVAFGASPKEFSVIDDIKRHTLRAIEWAEALGGWQPLGEKEIFDIEYWELEQAKLKGAATAPEFGGKIALVTGGAQRHWPRLCRGIAQSRRRRSRAGHQPGCRAAVRPAARAGESAVTLRMTTRSKRLSSGRCGAGAGWIIVICNAGVFPASQTIVEIDPDHWDRSISVNLTSQQRLLQVSAPYLEMGCEPAIVIIGSKNAPAPGPGAAAYSVAKAGLTQLARVAALELAAAGIRVNVIHPNAVFDTALWTEDLLQKRAASYGISVPEYKARNLLGVEITSADVADMACAVAGPLFAKTTGAQIPIDGGNERVV